MWGGNDLVFMVLATANKPFRTKCQLRAMLAVIQCYPQLIAHHLTNTQYLIDTNTREETFTSTGFRRLVYEGAYTTLKMLFDLLGTAPFVNEISRIDELQYGVLAEITAAYANRGDVDIQTLDVLMEYFGPQIHQLVSAHIRDAAHPNSFFCLAQTTNTKFIRRFLDYFREEGQTFVRHFALTHDQEPYDFQAVYAFAKAWCC